MKISGKIALALPVALFVLIAAGQSAFAAEKCPASLSAGNANYNIEYVKACNASIRITDTKSYSTFRPPKATTVDASQYPQPCVDAFLKKRLIQSGYIIKNTVGFGYYDNEFYGCFEGYAMGMNIRNDNLASKGLSVDSVGEKCASDYACMVGYIGYVNESSKATACQGIDFAKCSAGFEKAKTELGANAAPLDGTGPQPGNVAPLDGTGPQPGKNLIDNTPDITTVDQVMTIVDRITNWMFTIFLAVAVIFILYAAFTYLTSGGGEETAKAHKMLLYSAVAIAVAILAKGVVSVVQSIVKP